MEVTDILKHCCINKEDCKTLIHVFRIDLKHRVFFQYYS